MKSNPRFGTHEAADAALELTILWRAQIDIMAAIDMWRKNQAIGGSFCTFVYLCLRECADSDLDDRGP